AKCAGREVKGSAQIIPGQADEESLTEGGKQGEQETAAQPARVLTQKMQCVASVAAHGPAMLLVASHARCNHERYDGAQLARGSQYGGGEHRAVVKSSESSAACKPRGTEDDAEKTVGRGQALLRDHVGDGSLHDGFVSSQADAPEQSSGKCEPEAAEKRKGRIRRDDDGDGNQDEEPVLIEELSEKERAQPAGSHGERVEDRNPGARDHVRAAEVKRDERIIGEAESHQPRTEAVPPERRRVVSYVRTFAPMLDMPGIRESDPGAPHQKEGHERRDGEHGESERVAMPPGKERRNGQR